MKKTEKRPDGTERETHVDEFGSGEFGGEAPPDRSGPLNEEVLGTIGAIIPDPSPLPQEEGHPPTIQHD